MKILLVGEYSRLHNSLKEGLQKLGHEVVLLGFNDGFKNYPVDYPLLKKWDAGLLKKIKIGVLRLSGFDISSYLTYRQFWKKRNQFRDFDIVQLINENSFYCNYYFEKRILNFLFKNNKKVYLLSCGDDFVYVDYNFKNPNNPSYIQPYLAKKIEDKKFDNILKYRTKNFKKLHYYIYENIKGVIASDIDYHLPLKNNAHYLGLIPSPINLEKFPKNDMIIDEKIEIFHGINRESYYKKGNDYFEQALEIILKKYPLKVNGTIVENIPYDQFIQLYDKAHIVLDQLYGHDQGSNALEVMAKGKVVFTNASPIFKNHYHLTEQVAINALPNVNYLVEQLSYLIENPNEIKAIGKRARTFIEEVHNAEKVAEKYLKVWKEN